MYMEFLSCVSTATDILPFRFRSPFGHLTHGTLTVRRGMRAELCAAFAHLDFPVLRGSGHRATLNSLYLSNDNTYCPYVLTVYFYELYMFRLSFVFELCRG
jgi:hypothetical protein